MQPMLYAPLLVGCFFVPLVAIVGVGNLRGRTLALWIVAAVVLYAGLAVYDIHRDPGTPPRHDPRAVLWLALAAGLFIAHSLIVDGNRDRKYLAAYATDFRTSSRKACPRT